MSVQSGWIKNYSGKICPSYEDLPEETLTSPIYKEHDTTYYEECLAISERRGLLIVFSNNKP